jgi:hypothetical protein
MRMAATHPCCIVSPMHTATDESTFSTRLRQSWWGALSALALLALSLVLFVPIASAGEPSRTSFPKALSRVDAGLRFGIEVAPAALIEDLGSSSRACGQALEAELKGDSVSAQTSWLTLTQIIEHGDSPISQTITGAFARSHAGLRGLQTVFSRRWRDQHQLARASELARAVTQTQNGIGLLQSAVKSFEAAFDHWERHDCAGAQQTIDATNRRIPPALGKINLGMKNLRSLL